MKNKYVDLTMPINNMTPVFPDDPKPIFEKIAEFGKDGWNEHRFTMNSHFGTHIDFPLHMIENGKNQSDFEIEKFIGTGKLVDINKHINFDNIESNDIVLFYTNNSTDVTDYFRKDSPFISKEIATELIKRKVKIIGIDSWSPDPFPFEIHKLLLSNDILIVENLINLEKLKNKKFEVIIAPLKFDEFDGCPCRVFAKV